MPALPSTYASITAWFNYNARHIIVFPLTVSSLPTGSLWRQRSHYADGRHQLVTVQGPQSAEDVAPHRHQDGLGRHHERGRVRSRARPPSLYRRTGGCVESKAALARREGAGEGGRVTLRDGGGRTYACPRRLCDAINAESRYAVLMSGTTPFAEVSDVY